MRDIEDVFEVNKHILYMQILSNPAMMEQFSNEELSNMIRGVKKYVVNQCLHGTSFELMPEREEAANKRVEEFKRTLGSGPKPNLY